MSGDLPYQLTGYQQSSGDGNNLFNIVHTGQSQPQHSRFHPQMHVTQQQQQQNYQRLKVEDALSYLDKVKLQFSNQPEVYNKFLDIMKEFKSQTIDTPGVIDRVSRLFEGHSELIVGFNTFLPPGYKIEMSSSSDSINVLFEGKHMPPFGSSLSARTGNASALHTSGGGSSAVYEPSHLSARQPLAPTQPLQRHAIDAGNQRALGAAQSSSGSDSGSQPVEFDHAISYVNKIKSRYQGKPEVYKSFLEILHVYQKVQKESKDGLTPVSALTEAEVYSKVANLFKDQPDLLAEFGQFLPDAGNNSPIIGNGAGEPSTVGVSLSATPSSLKKPLPYSSKTATAVASSGSSTSTVMKASHRRRLSSSISTSLMAVQAKKFKTDMPKDISLAEAGKYGSLNDFAFFDKVRKVLNSVDQYQDFLRCLKLYTMSVISSSELLLMVQPFFSKAPEMKKRLKELVRQRDDVSEPAPTAHTKERTTGEFAMHIDFAACKLYTASYRGLPSSYVPPRCSGRTDLCNEVLNDTIVSVPSWSEDSSSVIKKTMAEEQIFRCEEDRYQLDIVLENVNATILVLNGVMEKLNQMTTEDQSKLHLDNTLGGRSEFLHRNTILKLYREHGAGMLEALKRNPAITVPLVLHRLRTKASELREAKRAQQKVWNEQNQKYFSKSLDHQGLYYKQNDAKALRSKALLLEIENAFEERQEQLQSGLATVNSGPMLSFTYRYSGITLEDATSLVMHHMKRQTSIHSEDKRKIKRLLKQFLPILFFIPPGNLSDDDDDSGAQDRETDDQLPMPKSQPPTSRVEKNLQDSEAPKVSGSTRRVDPKDDEGYSVMFANSNWYIFFRLHYTLCDRLAYFYSHSLRAIAADKERLKPDSVETAYALCLKAQRAVEPDNYYSYFLDMVRNYLDGNLETVSFEEQLREMFSIHAYIGFTMDKLIQNIVRQLQHIVADTVCVQLMELRFAEHRAFSSLVDQSCSTVSSQQRQAEQFYQRKAEQCIGADSCFRLGVFRKDCRLVIDMLEIDSNQSEPEDRWTDYMNMFATNDESIPDIPMTDIFQPLPTYLKRNVRRSMKCSRRKDDNEFSADSGTASAISTDMSVMDETECRFDINSYHRVYVVNKDTFLYRQKSLSIARKIHKKVSLLRHHKFATWVQSWIDRSTTRASVDTCTDFLLGCNSYCAELVPCKTEEQVCNDENNTPYYAYKRYHVTLTEAKETPKNIKP